MVPIYDNPYLHAQRGSTGRALLVMTLTVILGLFGSLTLILTSALDNHVQAIRETGSPISGQQVQRPRKSSTVSRQPMHHPAHRSPGRRPTPSRPSTEPGSHIHFLAGGNSNLPEIALTFDDGPNPYYTPQILAVLQKYGVNATFFDIGALVARYPNLVRQEYNAEQLIGNHTWIHPNLTLLSASQILSQLDSTSNAIQAAIGVRPTFFRPPYGSYNNQVLAQADSLGITTVTWNDDSRDWTRPGVDAIVSRILDAAYNGTIILMHDGGGDRSQTVAALPIIITDLQDRGFQLVTIQQMVDDIGNKSS